MEAKYNELLSMNAKIVRTKLAEDPEYFHNMAKGQQPNFLWLGCSDSRVPANEITGTESGDMFVHRNIANLVIHTDLNFMSVLQYAVNVLKVKHVIVCGHYGCGGIKAAMEESDFGLMNKWLRNIKEIYAMNEKELDDMTDDHERTNRLVELNVANQVDNLAKTSIMQREWMEREVHIHGWVYELDTGKIKDLGIDITGPDHLAHMFRFKGF